MGWWGINPQEWETLSRVRRELASNLCCPPCDDNNEQLAVYSLEESTCQNSTMLAPWSPTSIPNNGEKYISVVYKPPSLGCFVTAAAVDYDTYKYKLVPPASFLEVWIISESDSIKRKLFPCFVCLFKDMHSCHTSLQTSSVLVFHVVCSASLGLG